MFSKLKKVFPFFQSLDPPPGSNNVAKRAGHKELGRDPLGEGDNQPGHAELLGRGHRSLGSQGGASRNVSGVHFLV